MVEVRFYDTVNDELLKFAVIISQSNGKWVFCKHKKEIHMKCREGIEKLGRIFLKQQKGSCRKRLELSNLR